MARVLDTNVVLRHLLSDHPSHSPKASAFLGQIERSEQTAILPEAATFEIAYILERREGWSRQMVSDLLRGLVGLDGILMTEKPRMLTALGIHESRNVSLVDAYIAAIALDNAEATVISFDRDFDRIPGLKRIDP